MTTTPKCSLSPTIKKLDCSFIRVAIFSVYFMVYSMPPQLWVSVELAFGIAGNCTDGSRPEGYILGAEFESWGEFSFD